MKRLIAVGAFALVPIFAAACGGSHRCSGSEVILRAVPAKGRSVTTAGMQVAKQIITQRVTGLGVSSPTVAAHGDEIVIRFAGAYAPADVAKVADTTGLLQVFDFEPSLAPPTVTGNRQPAPVTSLYRLLSAVREEAAKGSPASYYLFGSSHQVLQGPAATRRQLLRPYKNGKQPPHAQVLTVPANREPVSCRVPSFCPGAGRYGRSKSGEHWYLLKLPPALTGKDIVESGVIADVDPNTGQPIVTLQFTRHGSEGFKRITKAEYDRGRVEAGLAGKLGAHDGITISRYAGHNAIVLDGRLEEAPYIDYTDPTLSQGIVGNAQIVEPSMRAAKRAALVLQSGSLPYRFQQVRRAHCPR